MAPLGVKATGTILVIGLLALAVLTGCGARGQANGDSHQSLLSLVRDSNSPASDPGVQSVVQARYGQLAPVKGFPEHPPFSTIARTGQMEAYPCSQCHDKPLAGMLAARRKDEPDSHWQTALRHAPESVMNCQTCHGTGDMDQMHTLTGQSVSMDAPYQICAQCHTTQVNDWAGGAHGKRLGGWAPPRVVETCTGCHNPHTPAFESRWPAHLGKGKASYTGR